MAITTNTYCSKADLELAVGGAAELVQLADPNSTGVADDGIVNDYLETGCAEIRSAVEVKHDPEVIANLNADSLRRLRDVNAALSARTAYTKGGRGLAMPEFVTAAAERADKFLDQLVSGERRLGRVAGDPSAAINQPAASLDFDTLGTKISIAGFRKGFR